MKRIYNRSRSIALKLDGILGTSMKKHGGRLYRSTRRMLSPVRRFIDPAIISLSYRLGLKSYNSLHLHLGCGSKHFDGYINVDLWITDATDVICNINKLPWPDNSASTIESYHVIEHVSHKKAPSTLCEWFRVLEPGGTLILECPHFDRVVMEYLDGDDERLLNIFGRQRADGDAHLFGYTPERLKNLLRKVGFNDFTEPPPSSSQSLDEPSFRIECIK